MYLIFNFIEINDWNKINIPATGLNTNPYSPLPNPLVTPFIPI